MEMERSKKKVDTTTRSYQLGMREAYYLGAVWFHPIRIFRLVQD